jgi:uncharacterized MnhB-related membrane protein
VQGVLVGQLEFPSHCGAVCFRVPAPAAVAVSSFSAAAVAAVALLPAPQFAMASELSGSAVSPLVVSGHKAPFIFIRRVGDRDVQHVLQWDRSGRRPNSNGVFGWVKCLRNCSSDAALPADYFRIHVCGHNPCTADYPASKYGHLPPPLAHGRVSKLLIESDAWPECEPECELSAPLAAVSPPLHPPLPPPAGPAPASPGGLPESSHAAAVAADVDAPAIVAETIVAAAPSPGGLAESSPAAAVAADVDAPVIVAETIFASDQARAMLARAEAVGQPRRLTGTLELVAFCCLRKRRLVVQLVDGWVDIMAVFAPSLVDATWHAEPFPVELFLCRWAHARKQWELAAWNNASHFMAGMHVPCVDVEAVVGTSAVAEGLRRGYIVFETVCDGDCGLDALTMADGTQRTAANRLRLRLAIRDVLTVHAGSPLWADIVEATQEVDVPGVALPDGVGPVHPAGSSQPMPRGRGAKADAKAPAVAVATPADAKAPAVAVATPAPTVLSHAAVTAGTSAGGAPVQGTPATRGPEAPAAPVPATGAPLQPLADLVARDAPAAVLVEAVRWATGLPNPTADMVQRLCRCLTDDHASELVDLHRKSLQETAVAVSAKGRVVAGVRPRRTYKQTLMWQRLADARAFIEWAATRGIDHRTSKLGKELRQFVLAAAGGNLSRVQANEGRRYMVRALKLFREGGVATDVARRRGARVVAVGAPLRQRKRRLGLQGRPQKAGLVKELLFEWFCSIKRSVKGRLPAVVVLTKARMLMEEFVAEHLRRGRVAPAAVVSSSWLTRWKRHYGVSLRQPNRRWKVSRPVLKDRLRIGWSNVLRVRKLIALVHGYDPVVEDFDQSPFHMNESGSRGRGTLALRGCPSVPLKECHAATRERYTANTMTTSSEARARQIPPLEILFKAKGGGSRMLPALRDAIPPWAPWLAVAASPSGSYSEAEVLDYMERHLEPMHPGRDWRILLVDSYRAQLTDPVRHLAWHRGYVLVVHGGGTTGVVQPNDTDLHGELKAQYCALEMAELLEQQRLRGHGAVPHARKSDVVCWLATVWAQPELHVAAVAGYKKTGLANALDGSEDNLMCREAKEFWDELRMAAIRAELLRTVEVEYAEGRLAWNFADVSSLVVPFPRTGTPADNQPDDEGSEPPNEPDDASDQSDDGDDGGHGAGGGIGAGGSAVAEPADGGDAGGSVVTEPPPSHTLAPCDAPALSHADADRAQVHQYNLDVLHTVAEQLRTVGQDRLLIAVEAAIHAEERRAHGRGQADPAIAAALVRNRDANLSMVMDGRSLMVKLAEERQRNQVTLAELRKEQARLDEQRVALQRATTVVECFNAVKSFDAADFGQGHPRGGTRDHKRARMQVLERLRSRSAPLPAELANDWEWFKVNWDDARLRRLHSSRRDAWGSIFRDIILELLDKTKKGEPDVLAKWMAQECREYLAMPVLRI